MSRPRADHRDVEVLAAVEKLGPCRLEDFDEHTDYSRPWMSQRLSTLTEHGLVSRRTSLEDARKSVYQTTERGSRVAGAERVEDYQL